MPYKRNQVETAIGRVFGSGSAKPGSEIRTRLKRLLETDRGLGRSKRSADPERANFAFYDMDPPGRGVEIWFSDYRGIRASDGPTPDAAWLATRICGAVLALHAGLSSRHTTTGF